MKGLHLSAGNKYNARKTTIDGITFDSQKEAARFCELQMLERGGYIKDLRLQQKFVLQPAFNKNGRRYQEIAYIADFTYYDVKQHKNIVEDVKGHRTREYAIKRKLFEYVYPDLSIKET